MNRRSMRAGAARALGTARRATAGAGDGPVGSGALPETACMALSCRGGHRRTQRPPHSLLHAPTNCDAVQIPTGAPVVEPFRVNWPHPMYQAPLPDLRFVLEELLEVGRLGRSPRYAGFDVALLGQILEEAGRFAEQVLAPINHLGDQAGASFRDGQVHMPARFRGAYRQFVEGGWTTLTAATEHGGQGQPIVLAAAVEEIWSGANVAFTLCPLLARGAVEALERNAAPELNARLLPDLVSGRWSGTMNLTEPQAGSDLAAIRTRATPEADHYRISGQKIFITYGEHDLTDNIVHMVLARIDGAPAGVHGISLFAVPKRLQGADGTAGEANDVHCVSIEHKLGIHASPTCVMSYGERGGALGYLIGEPNHGLEYMFVMMNSARLSVGVQGIG